MCPRTYRWPDRRDNLNFEHFRYIVDQTLDLQRVVLHGLGEPLLNPELFQMIRYLKARGTYVLFNSNALALNQRRCAELIASGLDEYRVSFDAALPATYKKIRGIAGLAKVKRNLLALMSLIKESGQGPKVSLWFTTMRENVAELPGVARFAVEAGIGELYVQRLVYFGQGLAVAGQSLYRQLASQEQEALQETFEICRTHGIKVAASGGEQIEVQKGAETETVMATALDEENPWQACTRPWRLTYIQANGDVSPCCFAPFTGEAGGPILGNVFETKLADIWQGPAYKNFRQAFLTKQPPTCCEGCGAKWSV
jgi:MoaA/NifB/PqqE/SkfB family radical SAM enzyme